MNNNIYITAPITSESGYGHKSRGIVAPIAKKYWDDVFLGVTKWGNNPTTGLDNSVYGFLKEKLVPFNFTEPPALHIHVGIPLEFRPVGKKNILFTSGVETTLIEPSWVEFLNKSSIDLIVVPSTFVKEVFTSKNYTDKTTGKQIGVEKPVVVIPEEYDPRFLEDISIEDKTDMDRFLSQIREDRYFLSCGQVTPKEKIGSDRKNVGGLIVEFMKTFKGKKDVCLLLKTNGVSYSNLSYRDIYEYYERAMEVSGVPKDERPSVYSLEGHISPQSLNYIMSHERNIANVSLTHGEGFGRFLLEATLVNKPLIVPIRGAHRDYCQAPQAKYVDGTFSTIPHDAVMDKILIRESKWFNTFPVDTRNVLLTEYNSKFNTKVALKVIERNTAKYHPDEISKKILQVVDKHYIKEVDLGDELVDLSTLKIPTLDSLKNK
jgi:hypothetical protein